jgi:GDPmannose 4,6-dehydratase
MALGFRPAGDTEDRTGQRRRPVALIFGITGQDGAYLAALLLRKGYAVHGTSRDHQTAALHRLRHLSIEEQVTMHSMAPSDFRSVLAVLQAVVPDEVYNLAGQTSVGMSFNLPMETFESISLGTLNILECLRVLQLPVRFYNAASSECFGNTLLPADEKTPFQPRSPYAMAKAAAFWAVANYRDAYGLHACSGILFNHESPLRPRRFVTRKVISTAVRIAAGSAERLSLGNVAIRRDWGWAPEYVDAMWRMVQLDAPQDFVIATGVNHSLAEFTERAFSVVGLDWRDHTDIDPGLLRPSEIDVSTGNPSLAAKLLSWTAQVQMQEMVALLVAAEQKDPVT